MPALPKLARLECVSCRTKGHHCQAQMLLDGLPYCLRCADGLPCIYETAQGGRHPEREHRDPFEGFEARCRPPAPRTERIVTPNMPSMERAQIRAELKFCDPRQVARRHQLQPCIVQAVGAQMQVRITREQLRAEIRVRQRHVERERLHAALAAAETEQRRVTVGDIQEITAAFFRMSVSRLIMKRSFMDIVRARQVAMFLTSKLTGASLTDIGRAFGHKHHTTVLHSIRVVAQEIENNQNLKTIINQIASALGAELPAA